MNEMVSCEYNMDSGCVELKLDDGTEIAIDCTAVENLTADNMYERSELDYLIYNDPLAYADLILNRVYRKKLDIEYDLSEMKKVCRTQFDPRHVDFF